MADREGEEYRGAPPSAQAPRGACGARFSRRGSWPDRARVARTGSWPDRASLKDLGRSARLVHVPARSQLPRRPARRARRKPLAEPLPPELSRALADFLEALRVEAGLSRN